jgi:predicted nucleic acid-binding protein
MWNLDAYIETSVWSHVFHVETPDFQRATIEFLDLVKSGAFAAHISTIVLDEVSRADVERRDQIMHQIDLVEPVLLTVNDEAEALSQRYIEAGVLPPPDHIDALHVAVATVYEMDVLVSWNQRHLANIRRRDLFNSVNRIAGYRKALEITNPLEVGYE